MFAACVLKNAEIQFNLGEISFKYPPDKDFIALAKAPSDCVAVSTNTGGAQTQVR